MMCTNCKKKKSRARGLCDRCYKAERKEALRAGRWEPKRLPLVNGGAAAEHLDRLAAAGISRWQVVQFTGIHHAIIYGLSPRRNVAEATSAKILAIPLPGPTYDAIQKTAFVPACGTTRRLQALCALGWPIQELADRLGDRQPGHLSQVCRGDRHLVMAYTARAVARLYDQLSGTIGPSQHVQDRARQRRWAPPLAWECECTEACACSLIDDPAARPEGVRPKRKRFQDRYEDAVELGYRGIPEIARALGITERSLARQLAPSRQGRSA